MIANLLNSFIANVGIAGLLVSSGLLIMIATHNVFEVDARLREDDDPAGGTRKNWEWRYMSDYAQNARGEVVSLAMLLKLSVLTALVFAIALAASLGIFSLITWVSETWLNGPACEGNFFMRVLCSVVTYCVDAGTWLKSSTDIQNIMREGFAFVILLYAPIYIYRLARLVVNVAFARREHAKNKKPWWLNNQTSGGQNNNPPMAAAAAPSSPSASP